MLHESVRITEIFLSIQGESTSVGKPTVFIRTTGCPLRCRYCDTSYAFSGGTIFREKEIISEVQKYKVSSVTVTGGEPLAQPTVFKLLESLCDVGFDVSLETSGAIDVSQVDHRVKKVVDIKTPGSDEMEKNVYSNIRCLSDLDQLKFVICDRADYEWSREKIKTMALRGEPEILFSPSYEELKASDLAEWILEDRLNVRLQVQLHKILWGDIPGR